MGRIILYLFSFFLGFGLYDPFGTNGLYLDIFTLLSLVVIFIENGLQVLLKYLRLEVKLLFFIAIVLFFSAALYGISFQNSVPINLKFIAAVVIFWFFSLEFSKDNRFRMKCISFFSLACAFIAIGYSLGLFNNQFEILNGRLRIFGENPNSISSRMAIACIIILYHIFFDPLKLKKKRFLGLIFLLPLVKFIIDTGSRGSLLILIVAMAALVLFSKIKVTYKILLSVLTVLFCFSLFIYIQDTPIIQRFFNEGLTDSRDDLWDNAITIFLDNSIVGVGEEGYLIEMNQITDRVLDTHNLFIYLLVTGGVFAFSLFLLFLFKLIKVVYLELLKRNSLPMVIFVFFVFLMNKTGGILTYLVMWYFLAYINSYSFTDKKVLR